MQKIKIIENIFTYLYVKHKISFCFNKQKQKIDKRKKLNILLIHIINIKKKIKYFKDLLSILNNNDNIYFDMIIDIFNFQNLLNLLIIELNFYKKIDNCNIELSIHAGQGGVDSQNFAKILMKMYYKYFKKNNFKIKILNLLQNDKNGLKTAIILIDEKKMHGYLKSEMGVHRMVRISPSNLSNKRHTSFTSICIEPEVREKHVFLYNKDIRIDTFKASGAGGQHINKTNSAIRMFHLPTKLIIVCQSERSQIRNKIKAFVLLKSKLENFENKKTKNQKKIDNLFRMQPSFGSQIKNYIVFPYKLVKDMRNGICTNNIEEVFNGNLNFFIISFLIWRYIQSPT